MSEIEEKEKIKAKIIEDINYLKDKEQEIQTALARTISDDAEEATSVAKALDTIQISGISYINNEIIKDLKSFYTNISHPLAIASRAFLIDISNKSSRYKLIEAAKAFNNIANKISEIDTPKDTNVKAGSGKAFVVGSDLDRKIDALSERIESLENKPDEIVQALNNNFKRSEDLTTSMLDLSKKSEKTLDDILKFKQEAMEQNEKLVTKVENTINQKISVLLSEQFEQKSSRLRIGTDDRFRLFIISIGILFMFNMVLLATYFNATQSLPSVINDLNVSALSLLSKISLASSKLDFWHFMMLKLTMNIPFFILIGFLLNEYTKSKKLYEEYEFRKILAITLFNNYERLTKDLNMKKEDLMESLKSSLDKIFDNPVHSIYGDKSGEKNIGLDQLEKFASIFEKMKK